MNPLRRTVEFLYTLFYDFHIEGRENVPEDEGVLIACNHRSYADPVFITMPMRKKVRYMAKEELFKNPLFGRFITMLGAFPIRRGAGDMTVINDCVEMLRSGQNVMIFPEGTRQHENKVGRGKTGAALIAARSGADVLPMGIVFEGKLHFRGKVTLKVGKVIHSEEIYAAEGDRKALNAAKKRIMDAITELVEGGRDDTASDVTASETAADIGASAEDET